MRDFEFGPRAKEVQEQRALVAALKLLVLGIGPVSYTHLDVYKRQVVVRLLRNLQVDRSQSSPRPAPLEEPPAPRALYKQACNAAGRGDYGTAALLLFAAMIALLDRQGAVDATASATVGDLRRELRAGNARLVAPFDAVAAPFVQEAYAERAVCLLYTSRCV